MPCVRLFNELFRHENLQRKIFVLIRILGFETKDMRICYLKTGNVTDPEN